MAKAASRQAFLGVRASAGRVVYSDFTVDDVHVPLVVAAGRVDGPTLVVHCAQHATEFSGSAMIGLLLRGLDLDALRGTVVIVPLSHMVNIARQRLPQLYQRQYDTIAPFVGTLRENINRRWPGDAEGNWSEKLAHTLSFGLFAQADAVLDYHSCRLCDPNFTAYQHGQQASRELALAFGFSVIDEAPDEGHFPGQLHRRVPVEIGTPAILVEMSPTAERTNWHAMSEALRGATNAMKHLGMLKGKLDLPETQVIFHRAMAETACLRAGQLGFGVNLLPPGAVVAKGDRVAEVRSLQDFSVLEVLRAPFDGALGSAGPEKHHVVFPGEELATVQRDVEVIRNR